ncbi:MAG: hypothetical protein QOE93_1415, partial [Actinomycetota bacterium]|nr:hypothetical protein [Actinomycetota bacterium]
MIIMFLICLTIVVLALQRAHREVDDKFVDVWAQAHALTLTSENRPMVSWYLRTARLLRTWGALGGLFLPPIVLAALGFDAGAVFPIWIFLGYLAGALYAELSLVRPVQGDRTASLVPRDLADYLPRRLLIAQRGLGILIGAGSILAAIAPYGNRTTKGLGLHGAGVLAVGLVGVASSICLERVQRWVVRRPQPFTEPALVAADDAIRAQSVHSLAGSGLAALLVLNTLVAWALAVSDVQVLRWTMWIPSGFGFPIAM